MHIRSFSDTMLTLSIIKIVHVCYDTISNLFVLFFYLSILNDLYIVDLLILAATTPVNTTNISFLYLSRNIKLILKAFVTRLFLTLLLPLI